MNQNIDLRLLELKDGASFREINQAYQKLIQRYGMGSLPSYGLFNMSQRQRFLNLLQDAFKRLVASERNVHSHDPALASPIIAPIDTPSDHLLSKDSLGHQKPTSSPETLSAQTSPHLVSEDIKGDRRELFYQPKTLKIIRESQGLSVEQIANSGKYSIAELKQIESPSFVEIEDLNKFKEILVFLAESLHIDSEKVVQDYLAVYWHWYQEREK